MTDPYRQQPKQEPPTLPKGCRKFEMDAQILKVQFQFEEHDFEKTFEGALDWDDNPEGVSKYAGEGLAKEGYLRTNQPERCVNLAASKLWKFVHESKNEGCFRFDNDFVSWRMFQRTKIISKEAKLVGFIYLPEKPR